MKLLLAAVLIGVGATSQAATLACPPIEYAQLKDSTASELEAFYCKAKIAEAAHDGMTDALFRRKNECVRDTGRPCRGRPDEFSDILASQSSCARVAQSVADMLKKQYAADPPSMTACVPAK